MLGTNVFTLDGLQKGLNILDGNICDNLGAWHCTDVLFIN